MPSRNDARTHRAKIADQLVIKIRLYPANSARNLSHSTGVNYRLFFTQSFRVYARVETAKH